MRYSFLIIVISVCAFLPALLYPNSFSYGWSFVSVQNNSFETPASGNTEMPFGYSRYSSSGTSAIFKWTEGVAHTGNRSVYIQNSGPRTALWRVKGRLPCLEGLVYRIKIWAKARNISGSAGISVRYKNSENQWLGPASTINPSVEMGHDWQLISRIIRPPAGASRFSIFLMSRHGRGDEIWFDDLSVECELDPQINEQVSVISETLHSVYQAKAAILDEFSLDRTVISQLMPAADSLLERIENLSRKTSPSIREYEETAQQRSSFVASYASWARSVSLAKSLVRWTELFGQVIPRFFAGWQDSMTRVWLRDLPVRLKIQNTGYVEAVKGEEVAVQLVVAGLKEPLKEVKVTLGSLSGTGGAIPASKIHVHPIGFVYLKKPAAPVWYPVERLYKGWWPEILLENFPFDVEPGDMQPVWISIDISSDISPGIYKGDVFVTPGNAPSLKLGLDLRVHNCSLPKTWHFRNIMSFHDRWAKDFYGDQWTPELREKFLDFLLARRINLTSMYGKTGFTWNEIKKGVAAGQNTILVHTIPRQAGLEEPPSMPPWISPYVLSGAVNTLDQWVPKLRNAGLLNRSLFYGFDEVSPEWFEAARHVFSLIKGEYPGLQTISTLRDHSYGLDTGLTGVVDKFVPYMPRYDTARAIEARAKGTKVWWYDTRWNIEQPLTRGRLIPWMTFKTKADGFLIWCLNRWRGGPERKLPKSQWKYNTKPVENKILNDWNPWLDSVAPNSGANYVYPGVNGPLSSIRLENFRDGIEDYDLLCEAADRLKQLKKANGNPDHIAALEKAITLEDSFILDATQADWRPEAIAEHRRALLNALNLTAPISFPKTPSNSRIEE